MPDIAAVIIPADIMFAIADDEQPLGWLGGAYLKRESLYIVTSAKLAEKVKQSPATPRLRLHRALQEGELKDELLRWFRVDQKFADTFTPWQLSNRVKLSETLGYVLSDGVEYICTVEATESTPKARAYCLISKQEETFVLPLDIMVLYRAEPYRRLAAATVESLSSKKIAIVGVGSGGGELAVQFASAGVGTLFVFDGERLEPANLIRHQLTRCDLGRRKVTAIATNLVERDLPTKVAEYFTDVVVWADEFRSSLAELKPDLIVCATDSRESRRFVNYCSAKLGIPLVIAGILDQGRIGEVLHYDPGKTACYECVRLELGAALEQPSAEGRPQIPYVGGEAEDLQSGAYRFDVSIVSGLATRIALHALAPEHFEALPTNYLVWGRERTEYNAPFHFDVPLSVNYVPLAKRSDCPVCGAPASELANLEDVEGRAAKILAEADEIPA